MSVFVNRIAVASVAALLMAVAIQYHHLLSWKLVVTVAAVRLAFRHCRTAAALLFRWQCAGTIVYSTLETHPGASRCW